MSTDTSGAFLANEWAREALKIDRKRLVEIIWSSAPPDADQARIIVTRGRTYDQFSYRIEYGQEPHGYYTRLGQPIETTSRALIPSEQSN